MKRNRILYFVIIVTVIVCGLLSRKYSFIFPVIVNDYLGDALWAAMVFFMAAFVFNKKSTVKVAIIALAFCYLIEISQLYHAPWIENIRNTTLGGLVLGFGFLWSDIFAYTLGVSTAALLEYFFSDKE